MRRSLFVGTPLKRVVSSRSWDGESNESQDRTLRTFEIANLERASFDPAIWDVPRDYRRQEGEFTWGF